MAQSTTSIYVLQLEHGKFYVGESVDPVKALEEHLEGLGPQWTQIHKPLRIHQTFQFKQHDELDFYVKLAMKEHGIEHVRGGSWESLRLNDSDRHALHHDNSAACVIA
jgi:predicted GIY-YIG superfamily endonuclease